MVEETLVMIKPWCVSYKMQIFGILDRDGNRTITKDVNSVPLDIIEAHYAEHQGTGYFGYMTKFYEGKKVILAVYEGDHVIDWMRDKVGPTDPEKAPLSTIRGRFSDDALDLAKKEGRPVNNVIHCSDSLEGYLHEREVWSQYLNG